jgi:cytochrome c-type biogenesis protein CcmH
VRRLLAVLLAWGLASGLAAAQPAAPSPGPVSEEAVAEVASRLRCVVCQNLSVQDSPSEMARQMRDLIRERLARGESRDQVLAYFEARYGQWVLLTPKLHGFGLLAWVLPATGLGVGAVVLAVLARRWARRGSAPGAAARAAPGAPGPPAGPGQAPGDAAAPGPDDRERVRRELERLG